MKDALGLYNLILIDGIMLVGVAIPHWIDDPLFGIPEEFGFTNLQAQGLAGFFSAMLILVLRWLAGAGIPGSSVRDSREASWHWQGSSNTCRSCSNQVPMGAGCSQKHLSLA